MIVVVETGSPGEGNRFVSVANWVAAALFSIPVVLLIKGLIGTIGSSNFDDSAKALSWIVGILVMLIALHVVAAYGSRQRRGWARSLSRALATLLLPLFPIGTVIGVLIFRYTSPGRWISE